MLNYPVLTIAHAIALLVTLEHVKAALEIERSQTARVNFAGRVREHFLAILCCCRILKALACKIFAADLSTIVFSTGAAAHELVRSAVHTLANDIFLDELETQWGR